MSAEVETATVPESVHPRHTEHPASKRPSPPNLNTRVQTQTDVTHVQGWRGASRGLGLTGTQQGVRRGHL